jgi:hypothetical protein
MSPRAEMVDCKTELLPNGANIVVTIDNVHQVID